MIATLFLIALGLFLVTAIVLAERSLRRQRGSGITRSREEHLALGHMQTDSARGAGGQGF
jgi:hypothetical protein